MAGSSSSGGLFVAGNGRDRFDGIACRLQCEELRRQMPGIARRAANESNAMRLDREVAQSDVR